MIEVKFFDKKSKEYVEEKLARDLFMDKDGDVYMDYGDETWELEFVESIVPHYFIDGKFVYGIGGAPIALEEELIQDFTDATILKMNRFHIPYIEGDMLVCQYIMETVGNKKYFIEIERLRGNIPYVKIMVVDGFDIKSIARALREDKVIDITKDQIDSLFDYIVRKGLSVEDYFNAK